MPRLRWPTVNFGTHEPQVASGLLIESQPSSFLMFNLNFQRLWQIAFVNMQGNPQYHQRKGRRHETSRFHQPSGTT